MESQECQSQRLQRIVEGYVAPESQPLPVRIKLALSRYLSVRARRMIKVRANRFLNWVSRVTGRGKVLPVTTPQAASPGLGVGDPVRVRSREEIQATLNHFNELRGCAFLPGMWQYCDTVQRVLKPLEIFVDERDYRVKRAKGIILLESVMCQGTPELGRCDRSCHFFWRQEWLEKI